jgi:hypothetical protein
MVLNYFYEKSFSLIDMIFILVIGDLIKAGNLIQVGVAVVAWFVINVVINLLLDLGE